MQEVRLRHSALVLIGWGLLLVLAWFLLVPRTLLASYPWIGNIALGIAFAAAVNTVIDLTLCSAQTWRRIRHSPRKLAHSVRLGFRLLVVAAILALALSHLAQ